MTGPQDSVSLAVIGGTGVGPPANASVLEEHVLNTPYGRPSGPVLRLLACGVHWLFLQRHGAARDVPPHRVNYRANVWALQALGAPQVLAFNAVGGISEHIRPGRLLVPDQLIDYTWGREHTFDEGGQGVALLHIEFTEPYSAALRQRLLAAAAEAGVDCVDGGVHGVTQGPRLESAAEIRRMARDGCDVVGMTGMPEAALARELGLDYASVCLVVNAAAGLGGEPLTLEHLKSTIAQESARAQRVLEAFLARAGAGLTAASG